MKIMSLSSKISDIEWELSNLSGDVSDLEDENYDLRKEVEECRKDTINETLYDVMKTEFLDEVSGKFSLEDLQEIFHWEPGKGIQLKLK